MYMPAHMFQGPAPIFEGCPRPPGTDARVGRLVHVHMHVRAYMQTVCWGCAHLFFRAAHTTLATRAMGDSVGSTCR